MPSAEIWFSDTIDPVGINKVTTISAPETDLESNVTWESVFDAPASWKSCTCTYGKDFKNVSTDTNSSQSTYFMGTSSSQQCSCSFPCKPNPAGHSTGWRGVHVVQHHKKDPSKDDYYFDITLKDAAGREVGSVSGQEIAAQQTYTLNSKLPEAFEVTAGNVDKDAVLFKYGDQSWGSNDQPHSCRFGGYDSGSRQGDCGSTC